MTARISRLILRAARRTFAVDMVSTFHNKVKLCLGSRELAGLRDPTIYIVPRVSAGVNVGQRRSK
jgi:hypothetical protein